MKTYYIYIWKVVDGVSYKVRQFSTTEAKTALTEARKNKLWGFRVNVISCGKTVWTTETK